MKRLAFRGLKQIQCIPCRWVAFLQSLWQRKRTENITTHWNYAIYTWLTEYNDHNFTLSLCTHWMCDFTIQDTLSLRKQGTQWETCLCYTFYGKHRRERTQHRHSKINCIHNFRFFFCFEIETSFATFEPCCVRHMHCTLQLEGILICTIVA